MSENQLTDLDIAAMGPDNRTELATLCSQATTALLSNDRWEAAYALNNIHQTLITLYQNLQ